ncbi:contractile injection system tape measure protein [Cyclobacterium sp.]|uniref:contractile injection system tape measure protein n=1 Tax=Cyclobacterium sp. TaxID=1966343 RepID=UPI0019CA801F|nr:contractile injection system tape measure protein [Cyclobacterium sp.]MBD3628904.1 hypothetical protein [Cyclobacterium sp.]
MSKNKTHSIQKVQVDIFTSSMDTGKLMERDVRSFIRERIFPLIEQYLDELESKLDNRSLQIPLLSLEIGFAKNDFPAIADLEVQINSQMDEVMEKVSTISYLKGSSRLPNKANGKLRDNLPVEKFSRENETGKVLLLENENKDFQAWIYFLEKGELPWWYPEGKAKINFQFKNLKPFLEEDLNKNALWQKIASNRVFFNRLLSQYSGKEVRELLWFILRDKVPMSLLDFERINKKISSDEQEVFFQILIGISHYQDNKPFHEIPIGKSLIANGIPDKLFALIIEMVQDTLSKSELAIWGRFFDKFKNIIESQIGFQGDDDSDAQQGMIDPLDRSQKIDGESHYLEHAGLVLIHPFLKAFFSDCGFLDQGGKLIEPELAVHTLYYLASRQLAPFDFELVFEKYLCGLDIHQPIPRDIKLSRGIREKAAMLLESLLENWSKLKNTGAETVRNEFLTRSGKLVLEDHQDRLFIERKAQDVLLDGLPWNLSIIKLPWRKKLLLVEW